MSSTNTIQIRLQCSTVSSPPVYPIDILTGANPQCWRANTIQLQVAIFDVNDVGVDLEDLSYLQFLLKESSDTDAAVLVNKTVLAADIIPEVSLGNWLNGSTQQATFSLLPADTDQALDGLFSKQFWCVICGVDTDGNFFSYDAGPWTIYNSGAPVAPGTPINSYHVSANSTGNTTITPTTGNHVEVVNVSGAARTSIFPVLTTSRVAGDRVVIKYQFATPLIAFIILDLRNATVGGAALLTSDDGFPDGTFTTDGYSQSAEFEFVYTGAAWKYLRSKIPA